VVEITGPEDYFSLNSSAPFLASIFTVWPSRTMVELQRRSIILACNLPGDAISSGSSVPKTNAIYGKIPLSTMSVLNRLGAKEVPWVVGLIAAILAWTLTHIVDRITSAPLISYQLEAPFQTTSDGNGGNLISGSFVVRNLTRQTAFHNLHFQINAGRAKNAEGRRQPVEGNFIYSGESFEANVEKRSGGNIPLQVLTYNVQEIQPQQAWRLVFSGLAETPTLTVRMGLPPRVNDPSAAPDDSSAKSQGESSSVVTESKSVDAVQLTKANWQTYLVSHELEILVILSGIFSFLLVLSLFVLRVPATTDPKGQ
jgi:hypothetical protein